METTARSVPEEMLGALNQEIIAERSGHWQAARADSLSETEMEKLPGSCLP